MGPLLPVPGQSLQPVIIAATTPLLGLGPSSPDGAEVRAATTNQTSKGKKRIPPPPLRESWAPSPSFSLLTPPSLRRAGAPSPSPSFSLLTPPSLRRAGAPSPSPSLPTPDDAEVQAATTNQTSKGKKRIPPPPLRESWAPSPSPSFSLPTPPSLRRSGAPSPSPSPSLPTPDDAEVQAATTNQTSKEKKRLPPPPWLGSWAPSPSLPTSNDAEVQAATTNQTSKETKRLPPPPLRRSWDRPPSLPEGQDVKEELSIASDNRKFPSFVNVAPPSPPQELPAKTTISPSSDLCSQFHSYCKNLKACCRPLNALAAMNNAEHPALAAMNNAEHHLKLLLQSSLAFTKLPVVSKNALISFVSDYIHHYQFFIEQLLNACRFQRQAPLTMKVSSSHNLFALASPVRSPNDGLEKPLTEINQGDLYTRTPPTKTPLSPENSNCAYRLMQAALEGTKIDKINQSLNSYGSYVEFLSDQLSNLLYCNAGKKSPPPSALFKSLNAMGPHRLNKQFQGESPPVLPKDGLLQVLQQDAWLQDISASVDNIYKKIHKPESHALITENLLLQLNLERFRCLQLPPFAARLHHYKIFSLTRYIAERILTDAVQTKDPGYVQESLAAHDLQALINALKIENLPEQFKSRDFCQMAQGIYTLRYPFSDKSPATTLGKPLSLVNDLNQSEIGTLKSNECIRELTKITTAEVIQLALLLQAVATCKFPVLNDDRLLKPT